ncbi:MAG: hypothetical protein OXH13_04505 [Chloroflexi bacterium]|nr:hypothetical protein [Chloroflexota bacterium]
MVGGRLDRVADGCTALAVLDVVASDDSGQGAQTRAASLLLFFSQCCWRTHIRLPSAPMRSVASIEAIT